MEELSGTLPIRKWYNVAHTVDDIQCSSVLCMMRSNDVPGTVLLASKLKVFQGNSEFPLCISKTPWGLS